MWCEGRSTLRSKKQEGRGEWKGRRDKWVFSQAPPTDFAGGLPTDGRVGPISTLHGVFPSHGDPELRSMLMQPTTKTTPSRANSRGLAHPPEPPPL